MARAAKSGYASVSFLLRVLQVLISAIVIVVIAWRLIRGNPGRGSTRCNLDGADREGKSPIFCIYGIFVGIVTIAVLIVVSCFSLVTCACCGAMNVALSIFSDGGLLAWWVIASILFILRGLNANAIGFPDRGARLAIMIAGPIGAFLFFASLMLGLRMATSSSRDSDYRRGESSRRRQKYDRDDYDDGQYSRRYRDSSAVRPPPSAIVSDPVPVYQVAPPPSDATAEFQQRQSLRHELRQERRATKKERRERRLEMEERERELELRQRELDVARRELEIRQSRELGDMVDSPRRGAHRSGAREEAVANMNNYDEDPVLRSPRARQSRAPLEDFLLSQGNV